MLNRRMAKVGFGWVAAGLVWATTSGNATAQCGGHGGHGGMGGHNHAAASDSHAGHSDHQYHMPPGGLPRRVERTPHGGTFLETGSHRLEVVYLPMETRVYLYGKSMEPLSTLALRGEMSPQARGGGSPQRIALQHSPPNGPKDQDYMAAAVDVTGLPDETPITFRFENLPDRKHSKAEFTPLFYQSEIRPHVVRVSFVQADREGYAQQRTCPVTGALLGSMGEPAKVLVGERPLYLCCAGCIEQVKERAGGVSAQSAPIISR